MSPAQSVRVAGADQRRTQFAARQNARGKTAAGPGSRKKKRIPGSKKIVNQLLPPFSRQLAAMLSAGMPIVAALEALEEQTDNPNFKRIIAHVRLSIENGAALSEALRQFPAVYDNLYCNMVAGGEKGGQLPETIARLAGFLEASAKLRRKVKSALMYPTIVLCLALAIAAAMIIFIVPVFGTMFADFGAELPKATRGLMATSAFLKSNGVFVFLAVCAAVFGFKKWKNTESGAYRFDGFLLHLPVFGELNRKVIAARFGRTLGQMIRSGVPILNALEIVAGATGNKVAGKIVFTAREAVEKGEPLSSAMLTQTVFPIMLVRMLQAGEKTGKIDEMMDNIATFYDDEVETMLSGLTALLEPLLMVFLGVLIGGIVLCMFLPIFKMAEIVSAA